MNTGTELCLFAVSLGTRQACGTGQQFARGPAGRFRTTQWSVLLLSAQIGLKDG
jgi:hypothetical protein